MRLNAPDLQRTAQGTVPVMPIGLRHFAEAWFRSSNEVECRYYVHVGTAAGAIKNGVGKKGRNCVLHIQHGTARYLSKDICILTSVQDPNLEWHILVCTYYLRCTYSYCSPA